MKIPRYNRKVIGQTEPGPLEHRSEVAHVVVPHAFLSCLSLRLESNLSFLHYQQSSMTPFSMGLNVMQYYFVDTTTQLEPD